MVTSPPLGMAAIALTNSASPTTIARAFGAQPWFRRECSGHRPVVEKGRAMPSLLESGELRGEPIFFGRRCHTVTARKRTVSGTNPDPL